MFFRATIFLNKNNVYVDETTLINNNSVKICYPDIPSKLCQQIKNFSSIKFKKSSNTTLMHLENKPIHISMLVPSLCDKIKVPDFGLTSVELKKEAQQVKTTIAKVKHVTLKRSRTIIKVNENNTQNVTTLNTNINNSMTITSDQYRTIISVGEVLKPKTLNKTTQTFWMQNSSTCDKATQTKVSILINIKNPCSIQLAKLPNLNRAIVNNKFSTTNTAVQPRCVVNKFCTFCKKVNLESPYGNILGNYKNNFIQLLIYRFLYS